MQILDENAVSAITESEGFYNEAVATFNATEKDKETFSVTRGTINVHGHLCPCVRIEVVAPKGASAEDLIAIVSWCQQHDSLC